jgi:uncharacterized protein
MATALLVANIHHSRLRPRRNAFCYKAIYICIPVDEFTRGRRGLFSIDAPNLFSLHTKDYGDGISPRAWIARVLRDWDVPQADGDAHLITIPRILGFAFNPVNFWLCRDREGTLRAVVSEVNNTFGERHCYLCCHEDRRPIQPDDTITAAKLFYVSPFIAVSGTYRFRFALSGDRVAITIDLTDEYGDLMKTSMTGELHPLTNRNLLSRLMSNPALPLKVIGLIHYQALRLLWKRIRPIPKPGAPRELISR